MRRYIFMPFTTAVLLVIVWRPWCHAQTDVPIGSTSRIDPAQTKAYVWTGGGGVETIALLGHRPVGGDTWEWDPEGIRLDSREVGWWVICARRGHVVRVLQDYGDGGLTIGCQPPYPEKTLGLPGRGGAL